MPTGTIPDLRPELTQMPERIARLPRFRGYPVPYFVGWVNGEPEFRVADARKWEDAVGNKRCWVCGNRLGSYLAFVLGPMCIINMTTSEPPSHLDCALWSVKNCPFLVRPHMVRRDGDLEGAEPPPGNPLERNPGASAIWMTRHYNLFDDGTGRALIRVGPLEAEHVYWFFEGRLATRAEVAASVDSGLPLLAAVDSRPEAQEELARRHQKLIALYPDV
ncbi:MAG TPA: hypothetical protein VI455_02155 [Terriglobia bacterium]